MLRSTRQRVGVGGMGGIGMGQGSGRWREAAGGRWGRVARKKPERAALTFPEAWLCVEQPCDPGGVGGPSMGYPKGERGRLPFAAPKGARRTLPPGRKAGRWDGREGSAEGSLPKCPLTLEKASAPHGAKGHGSGVQGMKYPLPWGIKRGVEQPPCKVSRRRCAVLPRTSCEPIYLRSFLSDGLCGGGMCADAA